MSVYTLAFSSFYLSVDSAWVLVFNLYVWAESQKRWKRKGTPGTITFFFFYCMGPTFYFFFSDTKYKFLHVGPINKKIKRSYYVPGVRRLARPLVPTQCGPDLREIEKIKELTLVHIVWREQREAQAPNLCAHVGAMWRFLCSAPQQHKDYLWIYKIDFSIPLSGSPQPVKDRHFVVTYMWVAVPDKEKSIQWIHKLATSGPICGREAVNFVQPFFEWPAWSASPVFSSSLYLFIHGPTRK